MRSLAVVVVSDNDLVDAKMVAVLAVETKTVDGIVAVVLAVVDTSVVVVSSVTNRIVVAVVIVAEWVAVVAIVIDDRSVAQEVADDRLAEREVVEELNAETSVELVLVDETQADSEEVAAGLFVVVMVLVDGMWAGVQYWVDEQRVVKDKIVVGKTLEVDYRSFVQVKLDENSLDTIGYISAAHTLRAVLAEVRKAWMVFQNVMQIQFDMNVD